MLLWLADHGASAVAASAQLLSRAAGATRRFDAENLRSLDAAVDALTKPPSVNGPITQLLGSSMDIDAAVVGHLFHLASAIDELRRNPAFAEISGEDTCLPLPGGALRRFVPAAPGAAWALNQALLARATPSAPPIACPGLISRQLFRDLEPEEILATLIEGAVAALENSYGLFERIGPELTRGNAALAGMSRNSRTRVAWPLIVAVRRISRSQLARALGLSRAGADIQARALSDAGLVTLGAAGLVEWARQDQAKVAERGERANASGIFSNFDATMADVDRLLARKDLAR
ncbi:MAG: hypothetical protein DI605_20355 [Sphingomonas sp.]|nr:MAG: hypothetical protein DI605_20355 [Sphingomonas sp.]